MVSIKATSCSGEVFPQTEPNHHTLDPKAASADAARKARQMVAWISAHAGAQPGAEEGQPDERELFEALQVCGYRATRAARSKDGNPAEQQAWGERKKIIRNHLISRNLGLAYAMLARFQTSRVDRDDLRSEAVLALVRAVEGFDPWRGFRFSTYACRGIVRAMIGAVRKSHRYEMRLAVDPEMGNTPDSKTNDWTELYLDRLRRMLDDNRGELTEREATVLAGRFGVGGGAKRTLSHIGALMGLTKERVRQIQNTALQKLRLALESDPVLQ